MRYTLKEFIEHYNPKYIQLVCGDHLVNIDTMMKGSFFLIKAFEKSIFYFRSFENELLLLSIIEEKK